MVDICYLTKITILVLEKSVLLLKHLFVHIQLRGADHVIVALIKIGIFTSSSSFTLKFQLDCS